MKTILRNLLAVAAIVGMAPVARPAVLVSETFSYPNGALGTVSAGLWTPYTSDQDAPIAVSNGQITLRPACSGGPCGNEVHFNQDLQRVFSAAITGQTIYAGFDVTKSGSPKPVYFTHFLAGTTPVNRLYEAPLTSSTFTLGIGNGSYSPTVTWPGALSNSTKYRVVLSYEFDTGTSKLWINPANQLSSSISFTDVASAPISAFGLRQDIAGAPGNTSEVLDNLAIGTRFRDVLAIPAPALPGDYDGNGSVGPEDYAVWRANFGSNNLDADGNGNGTVEAADYVIWRHNVGATLGSGSGSLATGPSVPEPSTIVLLWIAAAILLHPRRKQLGSEPWRLE